MDFALLHEDLEMRHDFVLKLLEPFVKFHVILICPRVVVLPATCFTPVRLRKLESAVDLGVERAVPIAGLAIELDGEHAGLHPELEEAAAVGVRLA